MYHRRTRAVVAVSRYPLERTLGLNTSQWDWIVSVHDFDSLATLRAVAIAPFGRLHHSANTRRTLLLVCVEDEESRRLRHVVVDARDRRERGGRQPPSHEAHTACFFSPRLQSFICVCAEMLWSNEFVRVCT